MKNWNLKVLREKKGYGEKKRVETNLKNVQVVSKLPRSLLYGSALSENLKIL